MENFLKDGCADKLLGMIAAKKHECAALYKKMVVTPEQAAAKATAKGKARKSRKGNKKAAASAKPDPDAAKEAAKDAKKKLAALSQELVRELVKTIEDEGMLKDAVSTGKESPATRLKIPSGRIDIQVKLGSLDPD